MDELLQLLRDHGTDGDVVALAERLAAATVPEHEDGAEITAEDRLLVFPEGVDPLTDEELSTLLSALAALGEDDTAPVELIVQAADAVGLIRAENTNRDAAAAEQAAEREAAVALLRGETEAAQGDEPDGDTDGDEPDGGEGDDAPADGDDPPAEGEGAEGEREGEPVLASGRPAGRRVSRAELARRRPRQAQPDPREGESDESPIVFAHGVPGLHGGQLASGTDEVDRALERTRDSFRGSTRVANGIREEIRVATVQGQFPPERRLCDDDGEPLAPGMVSRRIRDAIEAGVEDTRTNRGGMVAAGGLCVLPTPLYNITTFGDARRPIRDQALVSFQATRGGVTDLTPPTLPAILTGDTDAAISEWTAQNDIDAIGGSPVKPCQRVVCGAQRTTQIYAVTNCLTVGNFLARTYPELQNAWTTLAAVAHARFAEALLFARLQQLATTTTNTTTDWSASRDVLAVLDQTAAGLRSRHRLAMDFPVVVILPETLLTVMRIDISRQMPVGTLRETMALAMAEITAWFSARNITPVWSPDVNAMSGPQGVSALSALPPTINYVMYPAGTFIHLDGGELDLGVVRDTTVNATNDFQIFSETFENVHMVGPEAIDGSIDVCPSGAVSGTLDPAPVCASYT